MKGLKEGGGGHRLLKAMWSIALEPDKQQQPSDRREQQGGTCSCAYPALRRSWVGCRGDGPMAQGHHGTSSPAGIREVPATKEQRNAGGTPPAPPPPAARAGITLRFHPRMGEPEGFYPWARSPPASPSPLLQHKGRPRCGASFSWAPSPFPTTTTKKK